MNKIQKISESEKQIMQYIWSVGRAVTTAEILQHLPEDKKWKQNTVITFLSRLNEKGFLVVTKVGKANYYKARLTEQEYINYETKAFINDVHKGSILGLITTLCDSNDLTKDDIEELMERLKK